MLINKRISIKIRLSLSETVRPMINTSWIGNLESGGELTQREKERQKEKKPTP